MSERKACLPKEPWWFHSKCKLSNKSEGKRTSPSLRLPLFLNERNRSKLVGLGWINFKKNSGPNWGGGWGQASAFFLNICSYNLLWNLQRQFFRRMCFSTNGFCYSYLMAFELNLFCCYELILFPLPSVALLDQSLRYWKIASLHF